MSDFNISYQDRKRTEFILDRLASSLGCTAEVFFDPRLSEQEQTLELLRLWYSIKDGEDRAKLLAFVRSPSGPAQWAGEPVALPHAMQKPDRDP